MTNGYQFNYFEITQGIRQGDAMSALLYIIQSEPLAGRLRNSVDIKGIEIKVDGNSKETRLCQFVDDTDVFLKDKTFIEPCLKVFSDFEKVSGSKLNRSKTKGLIRNVMEPMVFKGVTLTTGPEIVLGVPLGKTRNNAEFWSTLIKKAAIKTKHMEIT